MTYLQDRFYLTFCYEYQKKISFICFNGRTEISILQNVTDDANI